MERLLLRLLGWILGCSLAFGPEAFGETLADLLPGIHEEKVAEIPSPDGRSVATLFRKERRGLAMPPEPGKISERWGQLTLKQGWKTLYDSGDEALHIYQSQPGFALDAAWAPDSRHLAYRHITSLRIIGMDGKATPADAVPEGFTLSSFRWIDNETLLLVSKAAPEHRSSRSGGTGPSLYEGYLAKAKEIHIARWNLTTGKTERYRQALRAPTFLFHSAAFAVEEISPNADRVAFSDGIHLCIYDDRLGRLLAQIEIPTGTPTPSDPTPAPVKTWGVSHTPPAQLDGIWWQSNDRLVIGLNLLGSGTKAFHVYDASTKTLADVTSTLLPVWMGNGDPRVRNYQEPNWYQAALK